jgi:phage terminase small subunit
MANHPHNKERPESAAVKSALAVDDMSALADALSYRQRRFCEEYIIDFNGRAAALRAGYSTKWADRQAYQLMMNKGVVRYIDHLTTSAAAKIMAVDPDYIIQGVVSIVNKDQARDGDKLRGYELLARILGMLVEKKEVTGKDGGPIEVEQRIEEEASDFRNMLKRIADKNTKTELEIIT